MRGKLVSLTLLSLLLWSPGSACAGGCWGGGCGVAPVGASFVPGGMFFAPAPAWRLAAQGLSPMAPSAWRQPPAVVLRRKPGRKYWRVGQYDLPVPVPTCKKK